MTGKRNFGVLGAGCDGRVWEPLGNMVRFTGLLPFALIFLASLPDQGSLPPSNRLSSLKNESKWEQPSYLLTVRYM